MNPYNERSTCPKCGEECIQSEYNEGGSLTNIGDYILRSCNRCGYKWCEACLDSPKE